MKSTIIYILLIIILLLSYCNNYIVFPFKIKKPTIEHTNKLITADEYVKYDQNDQISINIYMGTPPKELEVYLTMEEYVFFLGNGFCLSNPNSKYNSSTSTSYQKSTTSVFSPLYTNGNISTETFNFYNDSDLSKNFSVEKVDFIYTIASPVYYDLIEPDFNCGFFGLQLNPTSMYFELYSLVFRLKTLRAINNRKWSLIFYEDNKKINNYDGIFVLGITEDDFQNIFNTTNNTDNYATTYSSHYGYKNLNWEITFDEIYYNKNNKNNQNISFFENIQGQIAVDYNYIISNIDYFNSIKTNFFDKYINEDICYIDKNEALKRNYEKDNRILNIIICDKNKFKDKQKFPSLYLKNRDLNKIFELNDKDLFQEIGNSLIFLVFMDEEAKSHWVFGRMFLQKYQFIFDVDQKTISYIKKNITDLDDKSDNNNGIGNNTSSTTVMVLKILLIVFLILGIGIGLFVGKKLWDNKRKMKANELEDDYEYKEKKEDPEIN